MFKYVEGKFGNMRKPQRFVVTLSDKGNFIIQSHKSIGKFDMKTGEGILNTTGSYFHHLSALLGAKPYTFPQEFVSECCRAFPLKGDVIGSSPETGIVYYGGTTEISMTPPPPIDTALAEQYGITRRSNVSFEVIRNGQVVAFFNGSLNYRANFWAAVEWAKVNSDH